ncbi:vWA domain-containing protein [Reinekea marinisedimentorum]|uniref:Ca-activated chloride channel family protein n=1 Tax=Reinekea marinisedimentorum TaxID=230495 RepID=A0A4R3I6L5_9GAMM|nr:VWA domain-containing protein [Reinekea marinisedimentorum]TCS41616.1 Ca-activated chloride channel family protein [Reinekea marinisedimentorum]
MNTQAMIFTTALAMLVSCGTYESKQTAKASAGQPEPTTVKQPVITETEQLNEIAADIASERVLLSQPMPVSQALPASKMAFVQEATLPPENRENYAEQQISPVKITLDEPVSTFSIDVDTASYTNARRFLTQGQLPPAEAIRVEEFINYFDYELKAPGSAAEPIRIETEQMATPWNKNTQLLRVSLQAYRTRIDDLPPMNLVFLLDVSGSMNSPDKLPLLQRSFNTLVNQLRPQDHVAIAVYAGSSGVVLEPTRGDKKTAINRAINELRAGGSTHGSAGIHLAYDLAQENFVEGGINRIILATDGDFNVGTTSIDDLQKLIEKKRERGVFLSVIGFGQGNYNDHLMEELSNHGNGTAYYIDSFQEARKIFAHQLTSTLQTVAKDVKIQVEFNPAQVAEYRLIGYDNRTLNREDFNNDKIDAGEMGAGHSVTALYEIVTTDSSFRFNQPLRYKASTQHSDSTGNELAFVQVRYKKPEESQSELMSAPVNDRSNDEPSSSMQLAAAVAWFGEQLRGSLYLQSYSSGELANLISPSLSRDEWGYRRELQQLVHNYQTIAQQP